MPTSTLVRSFVRFREGIFEDAILPILLATGLVDRSSLNKLAAKSVRAETLREAKEQKLSLIETQQLRTAERLSHSEKKTLTNHMKLVSEVSKAYACNRPSGDGISSVSIPRRTLAGELVNEKSSIIAPLIEKFQPIEFQVRHCIPVGNKVIQKATNYEATLDTHAALAIHADIIRDEPRCEHSREQSTPDFRKWNKRLVSTSREHGNVSQTRVYALDAKPSHDPQAREENNLQSIDGVPQLGPFSRCLSGGTSRTSDSLDDYPNGRITRGLYGDEENLLIESLQIRECLITSNPPPTVTISSAETHQFGSMPPLLSESLPFIMTELDGHVPMKCISKLLTSVDFLHSWNAYLFSTQMYLHVLRREPGISNYQERLPQILRISNSQETKLMPEDFNDNYPTKVFIYTKADGRRCAAAFGGALPAEKLENLHVLLLTVDRCDCYEIW